MSKLRDRIRDTLQHRRQGIGFGAVASRDSDARRHLAVIAEVQDPDSARRAAETGVEALLIPGELASDAATAICDAAGDTLVGARLDAATVQLAADLADAGIAFIIFDDAQTEAAALLHDKLGYVLSLSDPNPDDDYLRLLGGLRLEALLLPEAARALTVRDQLQIRNIATAAGAPLIVPVDVGSAATVLETYRDAGAPVLLAPGGDPTALRTLLDTAATVRAPRKPELEPSRALVPSATLDEHDPDEDEFV